MVFGQDLKVQVVHVEWPLHNKTLSLNTLKTY